jgi:hypothetical protein
MLLLGAVDNSHHEVKVHYREYLQYVQTRTYELSNEMIKRGCSFFLHRSLLFNLRVYYGKMSGTGK